MKKKIYLTIMILLVLHTLVGHANWGWEPTDDPTPYYHQEWGRWYNYEETRQFMVQIGDRTYKYVFDTRGNFIGGWMTYMAMRLP